MRTHAYFNTLFSLILILSTLNGCASGPTQKKPIGKFETTIKASDIRLFSYSQPLFREKARPITANNRREDGTSKPMEDSESQLKRTLHDLEQDSRLKEYCPLGYVIIDQYAVLNDVVIRGECRYTEAQAKQ
ncbi:hypothetical protein [Zhongshania aquimaris]|uniref:hypothetical protein n=1 Tax=Zhongshania aquimaris TaxID=2857107 RepID=UPI001C5597A2|nr:hypothetical protein [Zhongshania aquimaris]